MTRRAFLTAVVACAQFAPGAVWQSPDRAQFFEHAGARLSYLVDRPSGPGPFPGIVLVHEGGQVEKASLAGLAATLVKAGFAVLRYDKRGVGRSTGTFEEVSVQNAARVIGLLAGDAAAAVSTLRSQAFIDASRVGLVGASQAGWVMPLAAQQSGARFFAAVAGPTVSVGFLYSFADLAQRVGPLEELSAAAARYQGPSGFDPAPILRSLTVPALWLMATDDRVVPTRESVAIVRALAASGKPYTVALFPGGHDLRHSTTHVAALLTWLDSVR